MNNAVSNPADGHRYGIGELCAAFDVTARTLRHYESVGLLAPERRGQTRLYTSRDRARLALTLKGKRFGFSLEEIKELLDLYDAPSGRTVQLARAVDAAGAKLADLEARRDELDAVISDLHEQIALMRRLIGDGAQPSEASRDDLAPRSGQPDADHAGLAATAQR